MKSDVPVTSRGGIFLPLSSTVLLLISALPVHAEHWLKLTTPDFELYTAAGERSGRELILRFEQMRTFYLKASPVKKTSDFPVRLFQFDSAKQARPYSQRDFGAAWFVSSAARDNIAITDPSLSFNVAAHEYMHLVIRHSGLRIPVWLNEGWADVYSTLRPMGKETAIGDLIPARIPDLAHEQWLDFMTLTSVTPGSPQYNEESRAGIFYAESWALAHMLYLAPEYAPNFGQFLAALNQNKTTAEAARIAWDRTPAQIYADLRKYFDRKSIYGRAFEISLEKERMQPAVAQVSDFEARLVLTDLQAADGKLAEAEKAYALLEKEQPANAALEQSLGYLDLQRKDGAAAVKHLSKSFDLGNADANMCMQLALLAGMGNNPPAKIIPLLERALRTKPDYYPAQMMLGLEQLAARDFEGTIKNLMALPAVTSDRASAVYCGLAYARVQTGDFEGARANAATCERYAKNDGEKRALATLTSLLQARSTPEAGVRAGEKFQRIAATATNLDCSTTPHRLEVMVGKNLAKFELPAAAAIEVNRTHGAKFDFACGPQVPFELGIEFAPARNIGSTSAGIIRGLEF